MLGHNFENFACLLPKSFVQTWVSSECAHVQHRYGGEIKCPGRFDVSGCISVFPARYLRCSLLFSDQKKRFTVYSFLYSTCLEHWPIMPLFIYLIASCINFFSWSIYSGPHFLCRKWHIITLFNLSIEPYYHYYHVYSSSAEHEWIPFLVQQLLWRRWIGFVHSGVWRDRMRPFNEQNAVSVTSLRIKSCVFSLSIIVFLSLIQRFIRR